MRIDAVTLFAPMFEALTRNGVTRRAAEQGIWSFHAWNPRDFTTDNYHTPSIRWTYHTGLTNSWINY